MPVHLMTSPHLWGTACCPSSSLSVWALWAGLASLLLVLLLAVSAVSSFIWMRNTASISASGVVNGTPVCSILRRTASLIRDASNPTCKATWEHNQMVQYSNSCIIPSKSTLNFSTGKLVLLFFYDHPNLLIPTLHATCSGHPSPSSGIKVHNLKPKWTCVTITVHFVRSHTLYNCHKIGLLQTFYPWSILLYCSYNFIMLFLGQLKVFLQFFMQTVLLDFLNT